MAYPSYLIHYNKNHSKANGQFVRGDGDGDGTADEHHRYSKNGITNDHKNQKYKKMSEEASTNTVKNSHREFTKKHIKEAYEAREAALDWMEDSSRENNIKYIEKVKPFLEGLGEYTAKALLNEYGEQAVIDTYNKESKDSKVKDSNDFIEKHKEQTVDAYWDPEDIEYMIEAWENDWN